MTWKHKRNMDQNIMQWMCDIHRVTQRSGKTHRIGSVQRFNGLSKCSKCRWKQCVVFKGDCKSDL
jgi:hypothetical protein